LRFQPHQPQRRVVLLCHKAQTSRCGKIECTRVASDFPDHKRKIAAPQPFLKREQGIFGRLCRNMDQPTLQIGRQSMAIRASGAADRRAVLYPQHLAIVADLSQRICCLGCIFNLERVVCQGQSQAGPAGIARFSKDLVMHRLPGRIRKARLPLPLTRTGSIHNISCAQLSGCRTQRRPHCWP